MIIIGIAGRAGSGKSTVERYLYDKYEFFRTAFADPLKDMLELLSIPLEYRTERKEAVIPGMGVSYRYLMQTLGTEWGRQMIGPDLWIRLLEPLLERSGRTRAVISDVRFPNEAAWVRHHGHLIHLRRPGGGGARPHVSELGLTPEAGEPLFVNDGSMEALYGQIDEWLDREGILK